MSLQDLSTPERSERATATRAWREVLVHHAWVTLLVGGLCWVATYVVEILIGTLLGEAVYASPGDSSSWLLWLWPASFFSATLFLSAGLLGVAGRVERRGRVPAVIGAAVASVGLVASFVNLVRLTGVVGEAEASDDLGFLGVVGVMLGSVLVGAAHLRGRIQPRPVALTLALLPLAFVPAIAATIPLGAVAPEYVVADLPFPVVGLILAAVGLSLRRRPAPGTDVV